MTEEPFAQVDLEHEIVRLSALVEKVTHAVAERGRTVAGLDAAYRRERAHAYLDAEGTVAERDAHADLNVAGTYADRRMAEASLDAAKEAGRNYRAQLEALRTLAANQRALVTG